LTFIATVLRTEIMIDNNDNINISGLLICKNRILVYFDLFYFSIYHYNK